MGIRDALAALRGANPTLQIEYTSISGDILGLSVDELWRTQPYLRTVVSFLARNIAQLGLHSFQRVSDTDRQRLRDDPIAQLLSRPNDHMTGYELVYSLVGDLGLHDEAFWFLYEDVSAPSGWAIEPLSPSWVFARGGDSVFTIDWIDFRNPKTNKTVRIQMKDLIWFKGWNPGAPRHASSPVEALKQILAEQIEAQVYRQQIWKRAGRVGGFLTRPVGAKWDKDTREKFTRSWQAKYSGSDGASAGSTPILEDGMEYKRPGFSAKEDDYVEGAKLALATVASVYHVNPTMIGQLDNANFSNVREFRRMLYGDTLGSTIAMIEDRVNAFLVPRVTSTKNVYVEFNINEKLQGSFEEQSAALQSAVGRPWMTADEARAKQNMPALGGDAEQLVTPLNVLVGGQASAQDSGSQNQGPKAVEVVQVKTRRALLPSGEASDPLQAKAVEVFEAFFKRQRASVMSVLGAKASADWWDAERWDKELTQDLLKLSAFAATDMGRAQAEKMGFDRADYDEDRTLKFLTAMASSRAGAVNSTTKDSIQSALDEGDDVGEVFDEAESTRAGTSGTALMAALAGFAVTEAGKQLAGDRAEKTWNTGDNARPEHAAMDGETVGINDAFSNGANWPGDPVLGAEGNSNCNCGVTVSF